MIEHIQVHETLVEIAAHVFLVLHGGALQVVHGNGSRITIEAPEFERHGLIGQRGVKIECLVRIGGNDRITAPIVREVTVQWEHREVLNDERRAEIDVHQCGIEGVGDVRHEQDALRALIDTRDGQLLRHISITELRG